MRIVEIVGHYIFLSSSFISSDITSFISFVFISSSYILYNCSHRDYSTDISHFSYLFHALHTTSYPNSQNYISYLNYHIFLDIFFIFVFFCFFQLILSYFNLVIDFYTVNIITLFYFSTFLLLFSY